MKDAIEIYEYYFENYGYQKIIENGETLVTLETQDSNLENVSIISTDDISYYLKNDYDKEAITLTYDGITAVSYKNKIGEQLGTITVNYKGEEIGTIPIILNQKIPFSIWIYFQNHTGVVIFGLAILTLAVILIKRKKRK